MARTTIPAELVAVNAIQGTLIADNSVTAVHIATNAISGTLVADNAVTSTHIAQNQVTATQIAQNTITVTQMADDAIETAKINASAVTTAKINNGAVTGDKLAANSVTSAKIVNGTIVAADLADNAVTIAKMASLARGSIIVGDSAGDPAALSIGSNTYVLTSDGTDISWAASSGGVDGISSSADATAITIDSSENVGINNTSPSAQLQVSYAASSLTDATGLLVSNTSASQGNRHSISLQSPAGAGIDVGIGFYAGTTAAWSLMYDNAEAGLHIYDEVNTDKVLTVRAGGNVGIGENDPDVDLHVRRTTTSASYNYAARYVAAFERNGACDVAIRGNSSSSSNLSFSDEADADVGRISYDHGSNYMAFTTNTTERMRITDGGDVSIGSDHAGFSGWRVLNLRGEAGSGALLNWEANNATRKAAIAQSGSDLRLQVFDTGSITFEPGTGAERMRIDSSGKLLIGDTASHVDDLLQIETPASGGGHGIQIRRNDSNGDQGIGRIMFGNNNDTDLATISSVTDGQADCARLVFSTQPTSGSSTERMRIDSGGRLLINKTTSSLTFGKLQVEAGGEASGHGGIVFFGDSDVSVGSGNVINVLWFYGDNDATGGVFTRYRDGNSIMGQVTCANGTQVSYGVSSDERLKENIVDASSQLDTIKNIKVREFDWKVNGYHEVGMIAQELHTVIPSVVQEGGDDINEEVWGVDYGKLTPYLIKAVQELSAKNDALEARIATLEG